MTMLEVHDRIDTLTEEVHALAMAMVSLDHQINRANLIGRRTLELQLSERRERDQVERTYLLRELVIERQLLTGRMAIGGRL
jgi:ATP-dependent Zn protease